MPASPNGPDPIARRLVVAMTPHRVRCAVLLAVFALVALVGRATLPSLGHGKATFDGHALPSGDAPIFLRARPAGRRTEVSLPLRVPFFAPRRMIVLPVGTLDRTTVDGVVVPPKRLGCLDTDCAVDLGPLRHGDNPLSLTVTNHDEHAGVDVSVRTGTAFAVFGLLLVAIGAAFALLVLRRRPRWRRQDTVLFGVLTGGAALRTLYVLGTPPSLRGHDTAHHYDYIRYVADHWSLPLPNGGFEYYQPPLYYGLMAALLRTEERLGAVLTDTVFHMQLASLAFSVASAAAALWAFGATLAWAPRSEPVEASTLDLALGGALFVTFPSLVYFASCINNDVLVQLTSFVGVALALAFWRTGHVAAWVAFAACVTIGLLTKGNTYVVVCFGVFCLAARRGTRWRRKAWLGAVLVGTIAVFTGWFFLLRHRQIEGGRAMLAANIGWLGAGIDTSLAVMTTFSPARVMENPYNWPDPAGHPMWEFFVRSALYGEFNYGPRLVNACRALLVLFALLAVPAARGWWRSLRHRFWQDLPMHALFFGTLASHVAFRVASPYVASQDFRYSFLAVLPFAYFVTMGVSDLRGPLRVAGVAVPALFAAGSAAWIVALWVMVLPPP
jgi:hypothetical protein